MKEKKIYIVHIIPKKKPKELRRKINETEEAEVIKKYGWKCFYCGIPLSWKDDDCVYMYANGKKVKRGEQKYRKGSFDHVIPFERGGPTIIGNIVPCCLKCNISKHCRTPDEWKNRWYEKDEAKR